MKRRADPIRPAASHAPGDGSWISRYARFHNVDKGRMGLRERRDVRRALGGREARIKKRRPEAAFHDC